MEASCGRANGSRHVSARRPVGGGMALSLTFLQPRPESWMRHWITGLAVLLIVELPVLGVMNRNIPNRSRLLFTAAGTISVLYGVVLGAANRTI